MATRAFRLRRSLPLASTIFHHHRNFSSVPSFSPALPTSASSPASATRQNPNPFDATSQSKPNSNRLPFGFMYSRGFSSRSRFSNDTADEIGEIGPDTILFEGCDYKHWLITMEFPKDHPPTPEEMVDTYVKTAAKVLGSEEEAKKKIYACSTTIYQGFQVEVSEEMSEKFKGLPGVVFVLPDSYIDPVNKEYGGDKYVNGMIIPRPPPIQYGRQGGRYNDRNRDYNRSSGSPIRQNRPPQPNYNDRMSMNNAAVAQNTYQGDGRGPMPSYQGERGNYNAYGQTGAPPRDQRTYAPPEQRDFRGDGGNFAPPQRGNFTQGSGANYEQGAAGQYGQGGGGNYGQGTGGQYGQGGRGDYGQGVGAPFGQRGGGNYGQGTGGQYNQGGVGSYGQGIGYNQGAGGQYSQEVPRSYGHIQGGVGSSWQGSAGDYGHGTSAATSSQAGAGNYSQGTNGNYRQAATGQYRQGWGQGVNRPYGQETGSEVSSQYGGNPSFPQMNLGNDVQGQQDELVAHKN